jgi:glucosyl-3-phosphoglycerate phosphatase
MDTITSEKIVYFVRHGQSEANISPVFQPQDSSLTDVGKKQAERIAERITKISFETLIASPLHRAKETAGVIAKATGKNFEYSDLFVECIKPTRVAGKSREDAEANELWKQWEKSLYMPGIRAEDGENYDDIFKRADAALDFLKNRKEQTMVVVTHGFFLRAMIVRVILGDALTPEVFQNFQARVSMENTGLSVLKYGKTREGPGWRLWIYNDHAHLG